MISTMLWAFLVAAMICDLKNYRIPNNLIALGYVAGCYLNILSLGLKGILVFCMNAGISIVVLYVLFLLHALGPGDVKLLSVMATVVGLHDMLMITTISLVLGAAVGLFRIIQRLVKGGKLFEMTHMHYSICIAGSYALVFAMEVMI